MRMILPPLASLVLLLAGCAAEKLDVEQPPAAAVTPPPEPVTECKVEPAQRYVGQRFTPSLPEGARLATGSRSVRVIRPREAVTMDYRLDRLNVELDARDTVTAVRCG